MMLQLYIFQYLHFLLLIVASCFLRCCLADKEGGRSEVGVRTRRHTVPQRWSLLEAIHRTRGYYTLLTR